MMDMDAIHSGMVSSMMTRWCNPVVFSTLDLPDDLDLNWNRGDISSIDRTCVG